MSGFSSISEIIFLLYVSPALIALHKYNIEVMIRYGFFLENSDKGYCSQMPLGLLISIGRFTIFRLHTLEWWATIFLKYEIASNQLDNSLCRLSPNSLAIFAFSGIWWLRFLYNFESVPKVATSKITHASGCWVRDTHFPPFQTPYFRLYSRTFQCQVQHGYKCRKKTS